MKHCKTIFKKVIYPKEVEVSELGGKMQYSVTSTGQVHEFNEGEGGAAFQPILNNLNSEE